MLNLCFPLENEFDVLLALELFAKDIRVSESLVTDGTNAKISTEVKRFFYQHWSYSKDTRIRHAMD